MKRHLLILLLVFAGGSVHAKDYNASLFGIMSNGTTLNTNSIQKAIDYIHDNGGGRLAFYVGRYLTGSIHLRSNVEIVLNEGATLVGSPNPYDYDTDEQQTQALIFATGADSIAITGQGMIDGQGREVAVNTVEQAHVGVIDDDLDNDRPSRPLLLYFFACSHVRMDGITLANSSDWVQKYEQCRFLTIDHMTVKSTNYWNNDALDIVDCEDVLVANSYFDGSDDAICLKSHTAGKLCQRIVIRNCVARSSANGVKFGTKSAGGFRDIKLSNITVYDTFRSAFTIGAVDGGMAENISIDSLRAYHTGNAIYLRTGDRGSAGQERKSYMKNISITNVYAEITDAKPDSDYLYEGPVEKMPRNLSPCGIVGLKGQEITDVRLQNVEIVTVAGGNSEYAKAGISSAELDAIPEMPRAYPEFSQFRELPAWGFYIRHARNITFDNVKLVAGKRDYRPAVVLDDVHHSSFKMTFTEPGARKKQVYLHRSSDVTY